MTYNKYNNARTNAAFTNFRNANLYYVCTVIVCACGRVRMFDEVIQIKFGHQLRQIWDQLVNQTN